MIVYTTTLSGDFVFHLLFDEILKGSFVAKIDLDRKIVLNGTTLTVHLLSALTAGEETEVDDIIAAHEGVKQVFIEGSTTNYLEREEDGLLFYNVVRGGLLFEFQEGDITTVNLEKIVDAISETMFNISAGDWRRGFRLLDDVNTSAHFTNARKDDLLLQIKTYVNNNYPVILHIP